MCQWLILIYRWPEGWWPQSRLAEPPDNAKIVRVIPASFDVAYAATFAARFNRGQITTQRRYWAFAVDLEQIDDDEAYLRDVLEAEDRARGRNQAPRCQSPQWWPPAAAHDT